MVSAPPTSTAPSPMDVVADLASDVLGGRPNGTAQSAQAQRYLVDQLAGFTTPLAGITYLQPFDQGTNILAVIRGSQLPDQYVMVGAHYDHLGTDCPADGADTICNGASDNAAGVAEALSLARRVAASGPPKRSLIIALWDREEDGLLGSTYYVSHPVVPLDQVVAYVNFDIQGTSMTPALRDITVAVGAETGGPNLQQALDRATASTPLTELKLSLLFGQGRSDHAVLFGAHVPVVFFTDANNGCYHTVNDEVDIIDPAKLDRQTDVSTALVTDLLSTSTPPSWVGNAPATTFADAQGLLEVLRLSQPDLGLLPAADRPAMSVYLEDLQRIVAAGPTAFDAAATATLLQGAVKLVAAFTHVDCRALVPATH